MILASFLHPIRKKRLAKSSAKWIDYFNLTKKKMCVKVVRKYFEFFLTRKNNLTNGRVKTGDSTNCLEDFFCQKQIRNCFCHFKLKKLKHTDKQKTKRKHVNMSTQITFRVAWSHKKKEVKHCPHTRFITPVKINTVSRRGKKHIQKRT